MSEEVSKGLIGKLKNLKNTVEVGSIYLSSTGEDPSDELGWGTWESLGTLTTSESDTVYVWNLTQRGENE